MSSLLSFFKTSSVKLENVPVVESIPVPQSKQTLTDNWQFNPETTRSSHRFYKNEEIWARPPENETATKAASIIIGGSKCFDSYGAVGTGGKNVYRFWIPLQMFEQGLKFEDLDQRMHKALACETVGISFVCCQDVSQKWFYQPEILKNVASFIEWFSNNKSVNAKGNPTVTVECSDFAMDFAQHLIPQILGHQEWQSVKFQVEKDVSGIVGVTVPGKVFESNDEAVNWNPNTKIQTADLFCKLLGRGGSGRINTLSVTRRLVLTPDILKNYNTEQFETANVILTADYNKSNCKGITKNTSTPIFIRIASKEKKNIAFAVFGGHFHELVNVNGLETPDGYFRAMSVMNDVYGEKSQESEQFTHRQQTLRDNGELERAVLEATQATSNAVLSAVPA